jgi:4-hydroxybenzoate polyprenyltransferase
MTRIVNFLLFTSVFITIVAVAMCWHTMQILGIDTDFTLLRIVAFSTLTSYNLHWYLTRELDYERLQSFWTYHHKKLHLFIVIVSGILLAVELFKNPVYIIALFPAGFASALYTLPKINRPPFTHLKKWAIAKTFYLTLVWTYVTVGLVFVSTSKILTLPDWFYLLNQFFYIYAICVLFDYKDIEADKLSGVPGVFHHFGTKKAFRLLYLSILLGIVSTFFLGSIQTTIIHLIPYIAIIYSIPVVRRGADDYFYYGWLDGCMMAAACIALLQKI